MICHECKLRWGLDEDKPDCPKSFRDKTTSLKLTQQDLYWIISAFGNSTPNTDDMEPGERAIFLRVERAYQRISQK